MMRARVSRLRSSRLEMRLSSRSCGVSAPTRAISFGTAAVSSRRFFQNSTAVFSSLPTSDARPTSMGRVSFLLPNRPAILEPPCAVLKSLASSFCRAVPEGRSAGWRAPTFSSLSNGFSLCRNRVTNVLRDVVERGTRREYPADAVLLQPRDVGLGNNPPSEEQHVVHALLAHELRDAREKVVVRARQKREADHVGILLQRGLDDLFGGLMYAGIDHLHARVAQGARHDLRAPVVTI